MLYLSLLSLLALTLTILIVKLRMKTHIGLGGGDNESLTRQIRVQANFLENFIPFSILFILAEMSGISAILLNVVGSIFLIARLFHAYGFSQRSGRSFGRYYGTVVTWISLLVLIVVNLYQAAIILI